MFGEQAAGTQGSARALRGTLPIIGVLALGVICGVAGAMFWSRNGTGRRNSPESPARAVVPGVVSISPAPPVQAGPQLRRVSVQEVNGRTQVALTLDQMVPSDAHRLSNPYRVYVDLHGLRVAPDVLRTVQVNAGGIQRIRIAQTLPDTVRVVLDLDSSFHYTTTTAHADPPRLLVELNPSKTGAQAKLDKSKAQ